ncbi:uncharacterized protein LOC142357016, partial [Convolutriloba macropyga]|uniref:uncharacterized protein LOC142357016 n=1 Tax=Convolutriloba macropyga TaxID=536237 RepID=UPI003F5244F5
LSVIVYDLDLCQNYNVTIWPKRGDIYPDNSSVTIDIRNWQDGAMATAMYQSFPQALGQCDICPSVDFADTCSFPFLSNGQFHYKCIQKNDSSVLVCKNSVGTQIDCRPDAEFCLSPVPLFSGDLSFETISPGVINITWDTNSDYYTSFLPSLNGQQLQNVTQKNQLLENLLPGLTYNFKVRIESYGRVGSDEKLVTFQPTDKDQNMFAYESTNSSAKFAWDELESDTANITQINVEATFEASDLLTAVFGSDQLENLTYNETSALGTTTELRNLPAGFRYNVAVSGVDNRGQKIENTSLSTEAVTVPNIISKTDNNVTLGADSTNGIQISFKITQLTVSETLHVLVTEVTTTMILTQDEVEGIMVVQSLDEASSVADVTCITDEESCVNRNTLQFTADVFQNVGLAPGSIYLVSIFGSTGPVEGEETALRHVE